MSKPFADQSGSGLHIHASLVDDQGRNVFDETTPDGDRLLGHAIAGLQATTHDAMAIFAPNLNAYRRFAPNQFVPVNTTWGFNNRSVSFRVPMGGGKARRIEHRIAGGRGEPLPRHGRRPCGPPPRAGERPCPHAPLHRQRRRGSRPRHAAPPLDGARPARRLRPHGPIPRPPLPRRLCRHQAVRVRGLHGRSPAPRIRLVSLTAAPPRSAIRSPHPGPLPGPPPRARHPFRAFPASTARFRAPPSATRNRPRLPRGATPRPDHTHVIRGHTRVNPPFRPLRPRARPRPRPTQIIPTSYPDHTRVIPALSPLAAPAPAMPPQPA